jgi:hypothetical protein
MNCYVTIGGYKVQVTLRGDNEQQLLLRMGAFLSQFPPPTPPAEPPQAPAQPAEAPVPEGWCHLHDCEMRRWEKDSRVWLSHKLADDTWCRGR